MSPPDLFRWGRILAPRLPTLARLYLPGAPLDARRREFVAAVVASAHGARWLSDLHTGWLDVLGPAELDDIDDEVFSWAAVVARSAPELPLQEPSVALDPAVIEALSAVVAHSVVAALTVNHARSAVQRVLGRRPRSLPAFAGDVGLSLAGSPSVLPVVAGSAAMSAFGLVVPDPAPMQVDPEPNLLAQLLADAMPAWLGGVWGRVLVAALPVEVPVAWRSGRTGATVRVGHGRVQVENGLAPDAWALFDGEVDSLVRVGSQRVAREVRAAHSPG